VSRCIVTLHRYTCGSTVAVSIFDRIMEASRMPTLQHARLGSLDCLIIDGSSQPSIGVVVCHGYGANYEDLAPLASEWIALLGPAAESFRFVFPDAPNSLAELGMPGGRAWWPINMARLSEAVQASRFDELHDHTPPGIEEARGYLCETVQDVLRQLDGTSPPIVLAGFSQGAMLTMDVALRGTVGLPARMFQFSGTVVCRPQWQEAMTKLKDVPVFQSHGELDPILPYSSAEVLRDMLREAGVTVDFHGFRGPHTIDGESVAKTGQALVELANTTLR